MVMLNTENFRPVGDVLPIARRDFPLFDRTLATPGTPTTLFDGEWVTLNANSRMIRATNIAVVGNEAALTVLSFPLWSEPGRSDVQSLSTPKLVMLWQQQWEFETNCFDAAAVVGAGAAISAIWQPLKVATITIGARNYSGLVGHGGAGDVAARVVGFVTRLPANNGGWLRLRGGGLF